MRLAFRETGRQSDMLPEYVKSSPFVGIQNLSEVRRKRILAEVCPLRLI